MRNKIAYLSDIELLNLECKKQKKTECIHCPFVPSVIKEGEGCPISLIGELSRPEVKKMNEIIKNIRSKI